MSIDSTAFKDCKQLYDQKGFLIINDVLVDYKGNDFEITIPDGVKEINRFAVFWKSVSSIRIPKSVRKIGNRAFDGTTLKDIYLENGNVILESGAFGEYDESFRTSMAVYAPKGSKVEEFINKHYSNVYFFEKEDEDSKS